MAKNAIEPVIFLPYKDKKLPFRVSWIAYKKFVSETGTDFTTFSDSPDNTEKLVLYGLIAGAEWVNEPLQIDKNEVEFVFDQNFELCQDAIADFFLINLKSIQKLTAFQSQQNQGRK